MKNTLTSSSKMNLIKKFTVLKTENLHVLTIGKANYSLFSFEKSNRTYGENAPDKGKHSRQLGELINELGMCGLPTCVFENGIFKIGDGQNRIADMMRQGLDIHFCLSKGNFQDTVIALNTSAKNLSKTDFVHLIATDGKGNKHYKILETVLKEAKKVTKANKKLGIVESLLISIYSGCTRTKAKEIVAKKMFTVTNKAKADLMVKMIYDLEEIGLSKGLRQTEAFVEFVNEIEEFSASSYDHENFVKKFKLSPELVEKINKESNTLPSIEHMKQINKKAILKKAS